MSMVTFSRGFKYILRFLKEPCSIPDLAVLVKTLNISLLWLSPPGLFHIHNKFYSITLCNKCKLNIHKIRKVNGGFETCLEC